MTPLLLDLVTDMLLLLPFFPTPDFVPDLDPDLAEAPLGDLLLLVLTLLELFFCDTATELFLLLDVAILYFFAIMVLVFFEA